jgi:N6-adenosine-specific RNA methylase IME4
VNKKVPALSDQQARSLMPRLYEARQAVVKATRVDEVKKVRAVLDGIAAYAKKVGWSEDMLNRIQAEKLRAERKMGALFRKVKGAQGKRTSRQPDGKSKAKKTKKEVDEEAGVSTSARERAEQLADVPENEFEAYIQRCLESGEEITSAGARRIASQHRRKEKTTKLIEIGKLEGKHRVIYADPPWTYSDSGAIKGDSWGRAARHYPTMTLDEICAMREKIDQIALDECVLFLWVPAPLLPDGLVVLDVWGFTYKQFFVWDKDRPVMGHYHSAQHEALLIGTRGSCVPEFAVAQKTPSVVRVPRTKKHSEKPEVFREIVDTLYPEGSRIELFARKDVEGWASWGMAPQKG